MLITTQTYAFTPPGGDPRSPIMIFGLQEYEPGQSRKVDVWRLSVPAEVETSLPTGTEFYTFAGVTRILAQLFCDGDESAVAQLIESK